MHQLKLHPDPKLSKVQQIVQAVIQNIEKGVFVKDHRLPSINEFSDQYSVARDTVEKAYNVLREEGYITSIASKGYFVIGKKNARLKVLLIFNKLSSYKKIVYDSLLETLGDKAIVHLHIHHYNPRLLKEIIDENLGNYHYYVIMPHFFHHVKEKEYMPVLKTIPADELILLDKDLPGFKKDRKAVFQDFKNDIYTVLLSATDLLKKYKHLTIVFPAHSNHPKEIIGGVEQFCSEQRMTFSTIDNASGEVLKKGTVYIVTAESDLAQLIKKQRASSFILGKDIGIISFNETVLKELLDITVITTDFQEMGIVTANMILKGEYFHVKNPFKMIRRKSL